MAVTLLAILFLVIIAAIAVAGYKFVIRASAPHQSLEMQKCAVCRKEYDKHHLIMRQVGDYKLLYFCRDCILKLYTDLGIKN